MHRCIILLLLVVASLTVIRTLPPVSGSRMAEAHVVSGEFNLAIDIVPAQVNLSTPFDASLTLEDGGGATCAAGTTDPGGGCYQAVTFIVDYPEDLVSYTAFTATPGMPGVTSCNDSDEPMTGVLTVGCVSFNFSGPNMTYRGTIIKASFTCNTEGAADFVLGTETSVVVDLSSTPANVHLHNDNVQCGLAPTDTPQPLTNTPTASSTATSTPTATPSPTPTLPVPPEQDKFRISPNALSTTILQLAAVRAQAEPHIIAGFRWIDSESSNLYGNDRLPYSFQRFDDPLRRYDMTREGRIDLTDALAVLAKFGQAGVTETRHVLFDPQAAPSGAQFLSDVDATAEMEIIDGWDVIDSAFLTIGGVPQLALGLQSREPIYDGDVNGSGRTDLTDVLLVLNEFGTFLSSSPPIPLHPSANHFKHVTFNVSDYANEATLLTATNRRMEEEIGAGWDPVDSEILTLDGTQKLVYTLFRTTRKHRADVTGDNLIDFSDALMILAVFGADGVDAWRYVAFDPGAQPDQASLLTQIDSAMEGQIAAGWDPRDSVQMAPASPLTFGLQLHAIPFSADVNGSGRVDITDALVALSLFGAIP